MRLYFAALFFAMLLSSAIALSESEEKVLQNLLINWPELRTSTPPWTSNVSDACISPPFYGLKCSPDGAHIVSLDFKSISLGGDLPDNIDGLSWLTRLNIENGCISGTIPSSLGKLKLDHLQLIRGSAQPCPRAKFPFLTPIPDSVARIKTLQTLSIAATFQGTFPNFIQLTQLKNIYLEHIPSVSLPRGLPRFTKPVVPESLETIAFISLAFETDASKTDELYLPRLRSIIFENCPLFSDLIQNWISTTQQLTELRIIQTPFAGSIGALSQQANLTNLVLFRTTILDFPFTANWNWPKLEELHLQDVPRISIKMDYFPSMPNLRYLALPRVDVHGTIPPSIGQLTKLQTLNLTGTNLAGELPSELGNLRNLYLFGISSKAINGTLPSSFGNWVGMKRFQVFSTSITGTIPNSYASWYISELLLNNNNLEGTIPNFSIQHGAYVDLSHNMLTGSIPSLLASESRYIDLSNNFLGPELGNPSLSNQSSWTPYTLPGFGLDLLNMSSASEANHSSLFLSNNVIIVLDLSSNSFAGLLPLFRANFYTTRVDLSYNSFSGDIPTGYCGRFSLDLSHNWLDGTGSTFLNHPCTGALTIRLSYNRLSSAVLIINGAWEAESLDLSHNLFVGAPPIIPQRLGALYISNNQLDGVISDSFGLSVFSSTLQTLDLSYNQLRCNDSRWFYLLSHSNLTSLSLQHNALQCYIPSPRAEEGVVELQPKLVSLDLSTNSLAGFYPTQYQWPNLAYLNLAHNLFQAPFVFANFPVATQIDLRNTAFRYDASTIRDLPYLVGIAVSSNRVEGSLSLKGLPNLQVADFTNLRMEMPDFLAIGTLFAKHKLLFFSMYTHDQKYDSSFEQAGLVASNETIPLSSTGTFCKRLRFHDQPASTSFHYDELMFNYQQCYCRTPFVGRPAHCYKCPPSGNYASCDGTNLTVSRNTYVIDTYHYADHDTPPFETESCYYTPLQVITSKSNCRGLTIIINNNTLVNPSADLQHQCEPGSTARLCARCVCDPKGDCYFSRAFMCAKCRRVFPLSTSIPLLIVALLVVIIIASIIVAIALRSKRTKKTESWESLPLYKRLFHRLIHLTSLGSVSILIAFGQLTLNFTNWDAYARAGWLQVVNGSVEGIGLVCLFPFLHEPLAIFLVKLFLPFAVVAIIAISVTIAEFALRWIDRRTASASTSDGDDLLDSHPLLLNHDGTDTRIDYPARALFSSLTLSAIKFFYFGTALTAHEYLFTQSTASGRSYVRNHPWMPFDQRAITLLGVSVPWIVLFDLVLPVTFLCLCWKVRRIFHTPEIQIYFGQLFETFSRRCFWWEIVNILRKLLIALFIEGLPSNSAIQPGLVSAVLAFVLVMQVWRQPWKRRSENMLDTTSALLLISSLLAVRSNNLEDSDTIIWASFALCIAFAVVTIAIIAYQTITERTEYHHRLERYLFVEEAESEADDSKTSFESSTEASLSEAEFEGSTKLLTLN